MTHEFKTIIKAYKNAKGENLRCVLATVVALEGSSYRKPGVRMLIREDGVLVGAVSGGCVEKEIVFQAQSVFEKSVSKLMTYDGRFRLGCEGILYIMIEPFSPSDALVEKFEACIAQRHPFTITTPYHILFGEYPQYGSLISLDTETFPFHALTQEQPHALHFEQTLTPCNRLLIIGGEHDAVQLSHFALTMGWEVLVAVTPKEDKTMADFPGIDGFLNYEPEAFPTAGIDSNTAVVLMTHSYVKDLKYLLQLKNTEALYVGLLGPAKRKEKLLAELMERDLNIDLDFVEHLHGPAGLDIGAITPQEIAVSILAEILTVMRKTTPMMLKDKEKRIHS
ncbi:MAG: XdhC family protein [Maribacter sp.]